MCIQYTLRNVVVYIYRCNYIVLLNECNRGSTCGQGKGWHRQLIKLFSLFSQTAPTARNVMIHIFFIKPFNYDIATKKLS